MDGSWNRGTADANAHRNGWKLAGNQNNGQIFHRLKKGTSRQLANRNVTGLQSVNG